MEIPHVVELKRKYDEFKDLSFEQLEKIQDLLLKMKREPNEEQDETISNLEYEISNLEARVSELEYDNDWLSKENERLEQENKDLKQEVEGLQKGIE